MICDYGCGQEAKYQFKNGKWCCSKNCSQCKKIKNKMSITRKGKQSFRKGKIKVFSKESKKKMSNSHKGSLNWLGKKHKKETKTKISNSKKLTIIQIKERYPTFFKIEEIRYNPNNLNEIQAHCKNHNCKNSKEQGGWFTLIKTQLYERIRQLEKDYGNGGSYFYCSEECKNECPLFNIHSDPNKEIQDLYTSEEYQTFRQQVLKREDYLCEYCENKATHVHHSRPQKLEPGFILDPDFGVACCESCHYKYGHKTGTECSTGQLANKLCN